MLWQKRADRKKSWRSEKCWTQAREEERSNTTRRKLMTDEDDSCLGGYKRPMIVSILLSSPCRETRLTEALDNVCERILQYNVHTERPGSLRYAKVKSASQVLEYLQKSCSGKRPTSLFLCVAGYESDHDNSEEPGQQRSEGGTGSAVRAVGRTVCRGVGHEEAGRAQHLLKVDVITNADLSVVLINPCVVSVRRCWSTTRRW